MLSPGVGISTVLSLITVCIGYLLYVCLVVLGLGTQHEPASCRKAVGRGGQRWGVEEEGREDAALSSLGKKNLVSLSSPLP